MQTLILIVDLLLACTLAPLPSMVLMLTPAEWGWLPVVLWSLFAQIAFIFGYVLCGSSTIDGSDASQRKFAGCFLLLNRQSLLADIPDPLLHDFLYNGHHKLTIINENVKIQHLLNGAEP